MSIATDLRSRVFDLSEDDRAELARELILSLENPTEDQSVDAAWEKEVLNRLDAKNSPESAADWREVVEKIRSNLTHDGRP